MLARKFELKFSLPFGGCGASGAVVLRGNPSKGGLIAGASTSPSEWGRSTAPRKWSVRAISACHGVSLALQTGAFAGALLAFGLALYAVKQHIAKKRKAELYEHRACT